MNRTGGGVVKWLLIVILVLGAAGAGVWYYKFKPEPAPEYQTAEVTRGDLTQAVTATGQLNPVVNVQVGSQISGRIQKLYVDYNSVVKSNQVIAEIEPSTYKVAVLRGEAEVANTKANLVLAEVQARRSESLFTNNLISASDHDTAVAQMQQASAQLQSAEANLENARVDLSRCTIYAPVDGVVISRNVDVGQTVAASFNTPTLFLIANDLTKMQIDALVSEADIGGVAVDQDVNFTVDAYPNRNFRGRVSQVRYGAITNQNVVNYDCVVEVSNPDQKLLPGMTANISIITAERKNALKVPNAALRFRPPELAAAESRTNMAGLRALAQMGAPSGGGRSGLPGGGPGGGGGQGGGRSGFQGGGPGGPGGSAGPGGMMRRFDRGGAEGAAPGMAGGRPRGERTPTRTVYLLSPATVTNASHSPKLTPVQIKTGINDGIYTEVLEGVEAGATVVTGAILPEGSRSGPTANPFSPGFRRF